MSVQETDRIDFMSHDAATNTFWLNMTEERNWANLDPEFGELKAKVNMYIGAVQSGDLNQKVPESKGKPIGIRLHCSSMPTPDAMHILSLIKAGCENFKIRFSALLLEGDEGREIAIEAGQVSGVHQQSSPKKPWWKVW
jgi:hypothetical protein